MKKLKLTTALILPLLITLLFQNCSDEVNFSSSVPSGVDDNRNDFLDVEIPTDNNNTDTTNTGQTNTDPTNSDSTNTLPPPSNTNTPSPRYIKVTENILLTAISDKVDILFVVDNSKSMEQEQKNMKDRINGFVGQITHLDWQIAVTSTDPRWSETWGDGKFRKFANGSYILKSKDLDSNKNIDKVQDYLGNAIQMGISGSGDERGIRATYRVIQRSLATSGVHREFIRKEAALVVVLISDEDECSDGSCSSDVFRSRPSNLLKLVDDNLGENKNFVFNSIIYPPGVSCSTGYDRGNTYAAISTTTGGIIGSVCEQDYTHQLKEIGQQVAVLERSHTLKCEPQDRDGDGKLDIVVKRGEDLISNYTINGRRITFDQADLDMGLDFTAEYSCIE